jgi:DNA-directed RNA polymerase III subunit RPC1
MFLQSCSRVLLPDKERKPLLVKVMNPSLPYLVRKALRKQILDKAKKFTICPHCRELNGTVKKCGLLKIVHEKYRSKKSTDPVITDVLGEFASPPCIIILLLQLLLIVGLPKVVSVVP